MGQLKLIKVFSYMTVQSSGRVGYMRYGVGMGGALDSSALAEGAYLVGNDISFGCLEFLSSGGVFEYSGAMSCFVINGGEFHCKLNGKSVPCGIVHALASGDRIEVASKSDFVSYLHIGGGVMVDETLGSRSVNVRSGLGGRLLAQGDILPIGDIVGAGRIGYGIVSDVPRSDCKIRVLAGSGIGYYSPKMVERFFSYKFIKGAKSDRFGSVLDYDGERIFADGGEGGEGGEGLSVISDAITFGDVQIQGDGSVVILLSDCQPTGGYPRIATVVGVDIVRFVRLGIGECFCFCLVSYEEARDLWLGELERRKNLDDYLVGGDMGSDYLLAKNLISGVTDGD